MKKFKALTASIIASAMAMSMTVGFAALAVTDEETTPPKNIVKDETKDPAVYTVSVINIEKDTAAHTYEAYQIFKATTEDDNGTEKLTITDWGSSVTNPTELIEALQKNEKFNLGDEGANIFAGIEGENSAEAVADVLSNDTYFTYDNANIQEFAEVVGKYLGSPVKTVEGAKNTKYTDIQVGTAGYYLIKETNDSVKDDHSAKTRYILTPTNTTNPVSKSDYPTITKQIKEGEELSSQNTAAIGGTVTYQLNSKVPDMTGYDTYFYIVNDSMFEGLTLKDDSFTIKVGEKTLVENTDFYYKADTDLTDGTNDFEIVFVDFIQYKEKEGAAIVITYDATLNEKAKIGREGNPNTVDLTFSNDPNFDYVGTPGNPPGTPPSEPAPDEPTGKTPPSKVITYTTSIKLTKVDANTRDTLKGAIFKLEGEGVNSTLEAKTTYTEDKEGTFYKLTNGTYTETAPDGTNDASYESTETKYKETIEFKTVDKPFTTQTDLKIKDDGTLEIIGLNPGKYTLTETKAADGGYILKTTAAEITITADPSLESCDWRFECENVENVEVTDGTLSFEFTNVKGVQLPGTGAFGTKLIYALGTIFTGAGAAYAISKKKSKKDEE